MEIIERKCHLEQCLFEFEKETFDKWKMLVLSKIPECMKKNLLRRSAEKLLYLNFDETVSERISNGPNNLINLPSVNSLSLL